MSFPRRAAVTLGLFTICVLALTGCPQGSSVLQQLAACSGGFSGTFVGSGGGTISGTLSADGTVLDLTFTPADPSILNLSTFNYHITNITGDFPIESANDISATFNFDNCSISGSWQFNNGSGTYTVSKN